jgi:hypothetical protein
MASTKDGSLVEAALKALNFVEQPSTKIGSPPVFKVTPETLDYLKGKTVTVASDGTVTAA